MRLCIYFLVCLYSCRSAAQDIFSAYEKHYYDAPAVNVPYRYLRPENAAAGKKYPLVIFLHGAYEKGFDNEAQLEIGGRFFLRDSIRKNYPAFVLFPQCPAVDVWAYFDAKEDPAAGKIEVSFPFNKQPTDVSASLMMLVDSLIRHDQIDPKQVYIGGLSQGGMGVLDLIARYPDLFAAAFSICGAGNVATTKYFAGKVPLWLFHGDADDVIPVTFSRDYYKRLKKLNADVHYSEYAGVKHNSWNNAFAEPGLLKWLFSKRKN